MSEVKAQRRFRWIAMGFAAVAMVLAIAAVVVVLRRGDGVATGEKPKQTAVAPVSDVKVRATDVVKIERSNVEVVIESGETKGLRIKDAELEKLLGLEAGDVLTALSGRPLVRDLDFRDAVFNMSMTNATTLYLEVNRGGSPTLVRWTLDGDLREARHGMNGTVLNSYGSYTPTPPAPDPLLDTIERLDDTHAKTPLKTIEQLLADPMIMAKGARVMPLMKNGKPNGLKLYAIRPSSVFARLNLANGDTVNALNGQELTSADKALEVYESLKDVSELTIDITRRGAPIRLFVTITK